MERVGEEAEPRAGQAFRDADVALHVHEGDGEEGAVFFQAADHAFLALGGEQEALGADGGDGGHGAFDVFFGDELEFAVGGGEGGRRHHGDDVEDVDAAEGGEVLTADEGRADRDERAPFVAGFGDLQAHGFDAHDCFGGVELVPGV